MKYLQNGKSRVSILCFELRSAVRVFVANARQFMFILLQSHLCLGSCLHTNPISFSAGRIVPVGVGLPPGRGPLIYQINHAKTCGYIACTCIIVIALVLKFFASLKERKNEDVWSAAHPAPAVFRSQLESPCTIEL